MATSSRFLPDTRTVWRWHFYAGLFCVPFVLWLSVTGSIYLFKPQLESWLDRPYDGLVRAGETPAPPETQVKAALAAVPGSNLSYFELPRTEGGASQIVVGKGADEFRVYVHPVTAQALYTVNDRSRPLRRIFYLHGELLSGDKGSMLVEMAGCWTIVLILTGLVLWWPRNATSLAGVLYPRFHLSGRLWWRDIHSVTGAWVSLFVMILLLTGLPWAKSWGNYFKKVRSTAAGMTITQDWPTGSSSEREATAARNAAQAEAASGGHQHAEAAPSRFRRRGVQPPPAPDAYRAINTIFPAAKQLSLAYPVQIVPPVKKGGSWFVRSDSQNRMLRDNYTLDPTSGSVLAREGFSERPWVDRVVSLGISYHEGQLLGYLNQAIGLFTAFGAATLALSSVVMWWRRRPVGVLGAPVALGERAFSPILAAFVVVLAAAFPMLGVSIAGLAILEWVLLRRIPGVRTWLGLQPA
ncbi:MAG: PepSY domain-containing protein [Bryobacteraceae bacterium]